MLLFVCPELLMSFDSPPMMFYSKKPVVVLPQQRRPRSASTATAAGTAEENSHEDNLDRHVEDCLDKPDTFRRVMRGVGSFLKTRTFFPDFSIITLSDMYSCSSRCKFLQV